MLKKILLVIYFILFLTSNVYSSLNKWLDDNSGNKGWYGYEVIQKKKEEKKKKSKKVVKQEDNTQKLEKKWPTLSELYNMYPDEINKWIEKASNEAIKDPTEENIKRWIAYSKIADRKATEFAGMWSWVMQNNPDLYKEAALYPTVNPGNRAFWKSVWGNISSVLATKNEDYALIFYKGEDEFSESMEFILTENFMLKHPNWKLKIIDVGKNPYLAKVFNINYTPQIYLLSKKDKKQYPLAAGPIAVDNLEKKIYHTIMVLEGKKAPQYTPLFEWDIPNNMNFLNMQK